MMLVLNAEVKCGRRKFRRGGSNLGRGFWGWSEKVLTCFGGAQGNTRDQGVGMGIEDGSKRPAQAELGRGTLKIESRRVGRATRAEPPAFAKSAIGRGTRQGVTCKLIVSLLKRWKAAHSNKSFVPFRCTITSVWAERLATSPGIDVARTSVCAQCASADVRWRILYAKSTWTRDAVADNVTLAVSKLCRLKNLDFGTPIALTVAGNLDFGGAL